MYFTLKCFLQPWWISSNFVLTGPHFFQQRGTWNSKQGKILVRTLAIVYVFKKKKFTIKQYLALFSTGIPAGGLISGGGGEEFITGCIFCIQVHVDGPITGGAYHRNLVLLWAFFK